MKYYLHDTNSFDDEKITELYLRFGYEGLGLFYTCLEKIAKQEKPVKTTVLKAQLKVGKRLDKCWNFMEEIGILSSNNGETFNEQLLNFSEKYQIKKEKTKEKVKEWREKQSLIKNVTDYENICNDPKVKESKVKESKVKEIIYTYNGTQFSKIVKVTGSREKHLDARIKEHDFDTVKQVIERASKSDFLNGKNDRGFKADFDWIMNPNNFIKILEGKYDNRTTHTEVAVNSFAEKYRHPKLTLNPDFKI